MSSRIRQVAEGPVSQAYDADTRRILSMALTGLAVLGVLSFRSPWERVLASVGLLGIAPVVIALGALTVSAAAALAGVAALRRLMLQLRMQREELSNVRRLQPPPGLILVDAGILGGRIGLRARPSDVEVATVTTLMMNVLQSLVQGERSPGTANPKVTREAVASATLRAYSELDIKSQDELVRIAELLANLEGEPLAFGDRAPSR
jgi:hypothetical protein